MKRYVLCLTKSSPQYNLYNNTHRMLACILQYNQHNSTISKKGKGVKKEWQDEDDEDDGPGCDDYVFFFYDKT